MASLEILPNELLQYLFHFLDGISLVKVSRVSLRCRSVVHNIIDTPTFWRRRCETDIPAIIKEELLLNHALDDEDAVSTCDWKSVYSAWFRNRYVDRWPSIVSEVRELNENSKSLGQIYHLRFFDDFLFTTHGNANCGLVKLWDTIAGDMLATVNRHPPPQRSLYIEVLVPWRFRFPRLPKEEAQKERRKELSQVLVISAAVEVKVSIVYPASKDVRTVFTHRYSSTPTVATSSSGDSLFAAVAEDGRGAVYRFDYPQAHSFQGRLISSFHCPYRVVESISLWRDLLVTGSGDGTIAVWRLLPAETDEEIAQQQEQQQEQQQVQPLQRQEPAFLRLRLRHELNDDAKELVLALTYRTRSYITDVFLRGEFVSFLDDDGTLTSMSDLMESGITKTNLFSLLQCRPAAICLSGSLLAIGDEAGKVSVFDLSSPDSPIHVTIFSSSSSSSSHSSFRAPYVFHCSSRERIAGIQICDDGHGPTIIVLSGKANVEVVRFFHPSI